MRLIKLFSVVLLMMIFNIFPAFSEEVNSDLRDYSGIELSKGTFIPVITLQEISTLYCDIGSKLEFLSTTNLYLNEVNIIPKETKFYGYVDTIHEPVVGTNASITIKVVKMVLPDGFEIPLKAYITSGGSFLIGGEKTEPATYDMKRSRREGFPSMVGYVPGATLKKGEHVTIASGANLIIMLVAPLFVTHTVTN